MAAVVTGALAGEAIFKYNRKNFMFDRKLKQLREFQEQDMRIKQFDLYREDVHDLVALTVSKMDLYMVVGALCVDKTVMMFCNQNDGFPRGAPKWTLALNSLSLGCAVFYFLLSMWLAMYASVSAQSFGTRLLTQFVRLPIASRRNVTAAAGRATDFESSDTSAFLRIPVLQAGALDRTDRYDIDSRSQAHHQSMAYDAHMYPSDRDDGGANGGSLGAPQSARAVQQDIHGGSSTLPDDADFLPTAMLDHIRLYRRVQLNWQAYDAYARVSLFVGVCSLLYSCLYWSLANLLYREHNALPGLCVGLMFSVIQIVMCRLDLRLCHWELILIGCLTTATPTFTTIGIVAHLRLQQLKKTPGNPAWWLRSLIDTCAVLSHVLHTLLLLFLLLASWPDPKTGEEEALLPGKFRSTLFLDVFGWLLNPNGPGATRDPTVHTSVCVSDGRNEPGESCPTLNPAPTAVCSGPTGTTGPSCTTSEVNESGLVPPASYFTARLQLIPTPTHREQVGLSEQLQDEARHIFSINSRSTTSTDNGNPSNPALEEADVLDPAQQQRWGGREAATFAAMEQVTRPDPSNVTTFSPVPPPRNVSSIGRTAVPGMIPWRAFCQGTVMLLLIWLAATIWAFKKMMSTDGWLIIVPADDRLELKSQRFLDGLQVGSPVWRDACFASHRLLVVRSVHAGRAEVIFGRSGSIAWNVVDAGCGFRLHDVDVGVACRPSAELKSGRCVGVVLRRGGRILSVCPLLGRSTRLHALPAAGSFHIAPGTAALQRFAVAYHERISVNMSVRGSFAHLRVFGRTSDGALLAFRPATHVATMPRLVLLPSFEVEPATSRSLAVFTSLAARERLHVVGTTLLSLASGSTCGAASGTGHYHRHRCSGQGAGDHCDDFCISKLVVWNLAASGERTTHRVRGTLRSLCVSAAVVAPLSLSGGAPPPRIGTAAVTIE